jgi:hypothetical protein
VGATNRKTQDPAPTHLLRALLACEHQAPAAVLITQLSTDRSAVRSF